MSGMSNREHATRQRRNPTPQNWHEHGVAATRNHAELDDPQHPNRTIRSLRESGRQRRVKVYAYTKYRPSAQNTGQRMTGRSPIIRSVDDEPLTENQQLLASLDGKTGRGGCEYCAAEYDIIHAGRGIAHMRVKHDNECPVVIARIRAWLRDPYGYMTNHDPGDEQA